MHINDLEACEMKYCCFWFHSEVKFLTRYSSLFTEVLIVLRWAISAPWGSSLLMPVFMFVPKSIEGIIFLFHITILDRNWKILWTVTKIYIQAITTYCHVESVVVYEPRVSWPWPKIILWLALFSWVPIFVDWTKMTHPWGSKFLAIVFSFIIHTKNITSWVLEFVDRTFHKNWYPTKFKVIFDFRLPESISV